MEHFVAALDGRIRSMGSTHELLSHRRWQGISLAELVERELAPYTTGSNTDISGPEVMLTTSRRKIERPGRFGRIVQSPENCKVERTSASAGGGLTLIGDL
jgi:hypothetical protein